MYLLLSCINHKSIMYLLSRYLSSTYHRFVIYLSYIYYLSILYLLSSNHISIYLPIIYLSSTSIYHISIIHLSSIYHRHIINLLSIFHISIAEEDDVKSSEECHPNLHEQRLHSCELDVM